MIFSFPRLFLSVLATSVLASIASAKPCPLPTTPFAQEHESYDRCPAGSGVTVRDLVECASGVSGFGWNSEDFDIFRSLSAMLGLLDDEFHRGVHALADKTFFLPNDLGMSETARALGYRSSGSAGGYDEEAILDFFLEFPRDQLRSILFYHVGNESYRFECLEKGLDIETLQGEHIITLKKAKSKNTPTCDDRVRLLDAYWKESVLGAEHMYGKVHKKYKDIETSNGVVHVVNSLLLPRSFFGHLTADPSRDGIEAAVADVR